MGLFSVFTCLKTNPVDIDHLFLAHKMQWDYIFRRTNTELSVVLPLDREELQTVKAMT